MAVRIGPDGTIITSESQSSEPTILEDGTIEISGNQQRLTTSGNHSNGLNLSSRTTNVISGPAPVSPLENVESSESNTSASDRTITSSQNNTSDSLGTIMRMFNEKGISFSLDDYGTGYSNQSNLMKYPYSIVKIDKSMVWACDSNPNALVLLKHTVAMIKDLNMKVLAEGVETEKHLAFLKEIGCDYLQGYYFSRPLPVNDLIEVIKINTIKGEN